MQLNGLILFITAIVLTSILMVPLLLCGIILIKTRNTYLLKCAVSIDMLGNVMGGPLFNRILCKDDSHPFGNITQTISYALAMNKHYSNLTRVGKWLTYILDEIDPGHTDIIIQRAIRIKHIN